MVYLFKCNLIFYFFYENQIQSEVRRLRVFCSSSISVGVKVVVFIHNERG